MEHMSSYLYGVYDLVLGYNAKLTSQNAIRQVDEINIKTNPDRVVGADLNSVYTLS